VISSAPAGDPDPRTLAMNIVVKATRD